MARYICDGHEYRTTTNSYGSPSRDEIVITNNYGLRVATLARDETQEYWVLHIAGDDDAACSIHENAIEDNLLEQWAVQQYVAWTTTP